MGRTKKLIANYENGFTADAKGVFRILKNQLNTPLACFRELVQNPIDEGASQIVFDFHYHEKEGLLAISVDDDGAGMDYKKLKRYFKMFDSAKEGLEGKIGKFGIGKISTFVLNPEKVIIETGDGQQGFKAVIEKDLSGRIMKNGTKKGTSVIILKKVDEYDARHMPYDIAGYLRENCPYSRIPIIINGERIGKKIDIEAENKISFKFTTDSGYEVEGVSAVGPYSSEFLALKGSLNLGSVEFPFNLTGGDSWRIPHLGAIADSFAFNHPISRNKVYQDDAFKEISNSILKKPITELAEDCASKLEKPDSKNKEEIRGFLLGYLNVFFDKTRKDFVPYTPKRVLDAKLFKLIDGTYESLENVCNAYKGKEWVYVSQQSLQRKDLRYFRKNKIPVVDIWNNTYSVLALLKNKFSRLISIDVDATILQRRAPPNSETEKEYLSFIGYLFSDYKIIEKMGGKNMQEDKNSAWLKDFLANFADSSKDITCDFVNFYDLGGNLAEWKVFERSLNKISLNISNPYIKSMINLFSQDQELAGFYTLCEALNDRSLFPSLAPRETENLIIEKMRGYLK